MKLQSARDATENKAKLVGDERSYHLQLCEEHAKEFDPSEIHLHSHPVKAACSRFLCGAWWKYYVYLNRDNCSKRSQTRE